MYMINIPASVFIYFPQLSVIIMANGLLVIIEIFDEHGKWL
jgi:hypothetical protein